ncbi:MAG: DUF559 domain-containing protein [Clostridiales bacterium]|nr:DUF559 domain-containing protein [Clostridiales bacterium]
MSEKDTLFTGYNSKLKERARQLRKNMTRQEKHLWYDYLRDYPIKIYRQRSIDWYIADFYCSQAKMVIELDGSQHFTQEGKTYDDFRTEILNNYGIDVIRFSNDEIDDSFEGVCMMIDNVIKERINK